MPPQVVNSAVRREAGTASVELIAVVPFLLLLALVAAQLTLAGQALWSAGVAARAGARAAMVGGDARRAARRALSPTLRARARVSATGAVSVRVAVPHLIPGLPRFTVAASTQLEPGDG